MVVVFWIIVITAAILAIAGLLEVKLKRDRHHPLTGAFGQQQRAQPDPVVMTLDMDHVRAALRTNNMAASLPGNHTTSGRYPFMPSSPRMIKDDETYAQRWFQAFGNSRKEMK